MYMKKKNRKKVGKNALRSYRSWSPRYTWITMVAGVGKGTDMGKEGRSERDVNARARGETRDGRGSQKNSLYSSSPPLHVGGEKNKIKLYV